MTRVAVPVCLIGVMIATAANAHHPGGVGNTTGAGPIFTISAATLEQGHAALGLWYEYSRLSGLSDAQLIAAVGLIRYEIVGQIQIWNPVDTKARSSVGAALHTLTNLSIQTSKNVISRSPPGHKGVACHCSPCRVPTLNAPGTCEKSARAVVSAGIATACVHGSG